MTFKDKKIVSKAIGALTAVYFLIAFMVMWASPDIPWDTALVKAGEQSFWFALVMFVLQFGLLSWATKRIK